MARRWVLLQDSAKSECLCRMIEANCTRRGRDFSFAGLAVSCACLFTYASIRHGMRDFANL